MIMANRDSMETGCESQRIEFFPRANFSAILTSERSYIFEILAC